MALIQSLITKFIINVFFKLFLSRIIYGLFFGGLVVLGGYLLHRNKLPVNQDLVGYITLYFFAAGVMFDIFKVGNYLLRAGLFILSFSTPLYFLSKYIPYKHMSYVNLSIGLMLFLAYEFKRLVKFRNKINTYKSLLEVDAMGNGDTYEKGRQFEEYVCALYKKLGYKAMTTTEMRQKGQLPGDIQKRGGSGEQGVDVYVYDHINKQHIIIQCKHYSSKISNSAVQEIVAAMPLYKADRAIVVTNQYFTEPAKELAFANNVALVDRDGLAKFIEHVNDPTSPKAA